MHLSARKKRHLVIDLLVILLLIALDQVTKYLAVLYLKDQDAIRLIPGVLELTFLKNNGAAFGILQNQKVFFIMIAVLILVVIAYVLIRLPEEKRFLSMEFLLLPIAEGAAGNMIDRIRHDYVVDFISFIIINFPVFNVADIYITVATFIFVILFLFFYEERDFNFLTFRQQHKYRGFK